MKKEHWTRHASVQDHTDGLLSYVSGGTQNHFALKADAKEILFKGKTLNLRNVHDTYSLEEQSQHSKKRVLSQKVINKQFQSHEALSHGVDLKASHRIRMIAEDGNIMLVDINLDTPEFILEAIKGTVTFALGTNTQSSFRSEQSSDLWWQRFTREVGEHQTYTQNKITGIVKVHSKETLIEHVKGQTIEWLERFQQTGGNVNHIIKEESSQGR